MPLPALETLALLFLLGMRHGLDPDHIAVIDNITFRALDERPRAAAWTGLLFSAGHTVSVLVIASVFGILGTLVTLPPLFETVMAITVAGLLVLTGTLNLKGLIGKPAYVPRGWRHGVVPGALRGSTHPLVTAAIGLIFGLVIDTAAQVAAWGTAASSTGGVFGAIAIGLSFALGMILTDGLDSVVVTRLVTRGPDVARTRIYRRGIGWLIVAVSYAMAGYALLHLLVPNTALSDSHALILGGILAGGVIAAAFIGRRRR